MTDIKEASPSVIHSWRSTKWRKRRTKYTTDAQTLSPGLTYNLRIGTESGDDDVMPAMADLTTGYRRVPARGNVEQSRSWRIGGLAGGQTYYWSVQAIDNTFAGGAWAAEGSFPMPISTRYVSTGSSTPGAGYGTWETAAHHIQEAVDVCGAGETVLVAGGVYNAHGRAVPGSTLKNRVMVNKAISLQSIDGPVDTVIDGSAAVRGVYLVNGAVLSGFTVTNGHTLTTGDGHREQGGGGIFMNGGGLVTNCIVTSCWAGHTGGGIDLHSRGTVVDCEIRDNYSDYRAGGVVIDGATSLITDCRIHGNSADGDGGGLYIYETGTAEGVNVYSNTAGYWGGGIYMKDGSPVVSNCTIEANNSWNGAGGILLRTGALVDHSIVRGNHGGDESTEDGGGLYFYNGGMVRNSLVEGNSAQNFGGGVFFNTLATNAVLENCTVASNTAALGDSGGGADGMRIWAGTVRNCIIYGNGENWSLGGGTPIIEYTCTTPVSGIPGGTGCIDADPLFVGGGDHRLQPASPCIDAGTNTTGVVDDLDGTPRPLDGDTNGTTIVDMGCYEHLNTAADSDGDTMTDGFEDDYGLDPTDDSDATGNFDSDPHNNLQEFIADTDPTDSDDYFRITAISNHSPTTVYFESSSNRVYTMSGCSNLLDGTWTNVPGASIRTGVGGADSMTDTNVPPRGPYYRLGVEQPR